MDQAEDLRVRPVEITRQAGGNRMYVRWADGHESYFDWEFLRWRCPCAWCSGEWGQPGAMASTQELSPDQVEMVDIELVGRYAVNPVWKDQHHTGIFTFRYLRELCPCPSCQPGRA